MRLLIAALCLAAAPVSALEICEDWWFTRNLIFDRAGYCFGSELGKTVFGNADCTSTSPALTEAEKALVARLRQMEKDYGCQVDTSQTRLPVRLMSLRKAVEDLPVGTEYESGCIGWQGGAVQLRLGTRPDAPVTGTLTPGDNVLYEFEPQGDWEFVTVTNESGKEIAGWVILPLGEASCEMFAG